MGEVYRAHDTRLDRAVAIKVLPEHAASDPDLRRRFEREAKTISSLNHPHICTLYDIGSQDGIDFLVMEYLEGVTLAQRLEKGPLPLDQALTMAIEIADALDMAHRRGVIHRDLKPNNIMLTEAGVKLLDFGLAKARPTGVLGTEHDSETVTQTEPLTGQGMLLGTVQYMAPEQLQGKEADTRTDIFAFGAVIYEMVAGTRAFQGDTQASLIAAILEHEPRPASALRPLTPRALDRLIRACLEKDPDERWQSGKDLSRALEWIVGDGSNNGDADADRRPRFGMPVVAGVAVAAMLAGALAAWVLTSSDTLQAPSTGRFYVNTPPNSELRKTGIFPEVAISPDAQRIVWASGSSGGSSTLYVRQLDQLDPTLVRDVVGATPPFFSPDGQRLGFYDSTDENCLLGSDC